jgi:group I intron endonuclease
MIIYKATNLINGKFYIGQTTKSLERRMNQHKSSSNNKDYAFCRAIKKYGFENFKFEVLCECSSIEELNQKEIDFIRDFKANVNRIGYNMTIGGNGYGCGENHPNFGKKRSEELRIRISESLKGRSKSDESKLKMSQAKIGKKKSEDAKKKMSQAKIGRKHPFYDHTIYQFQHLEHGIEICTKQDLETKFNLKQGCLAKVCKGERNHHKGWRLYREGWDETQYTKKSKDKRSAAVSGSNNPRYNHTVFHFEHPEFGSKFCTRHDLQTKFNLHGVSLGRLCKGEQSHHKGWKVITPQTPEENV